MPALTATLRKARTATRLLLSDPREFWRTFGHKIAKPYHHVRLYFAPMADEEVSDGTPRLLVDVTITDGLPYQTGIQRVVQKTTEALTDLSQKPDVEPKRRVVPIVLTWDGIAAAQNFLTGAIVRRRKLQAIGEHETLLMLDANWTNYASFKPSFQAIQNGGGRVATVVYDLVPVLHPELCEPNMPARYNAWLQEAVAVSDVLICISRTVHDELENYLATSGLKRRDGQRLRSFHLGSDVVDDRTTSENQQPARETNVRSGLRKFLTGAETAFLMVGTIEPRKSHALALAEMEKMWADGSSARLVFLGRKGWRMDDFVKRLRAHPERGRRLLWLDDATDAEIHFAYTQSTALLFPSLYEGYGLPVVEALRTGLPVIASDLPVIREISGDAPHYIAVGDGAALGEAIKTLAERGPSSERVSARGVAQLSWMESGEELWDCLFGENLA